MFRFALYDKVTLSFCAEGEECNQRTHPQPPLLRREGESKKNTNIPLIISKIKPTNSFVGDKKFSLYLMDSANNITTKQTSDVLKTSEFFLDVSLLLNMTNGLVSFPAAKRRIS